MESPARAAFFDLDNTLLRGTALIHLGRGLYHRGILPARTMVRAAWLEAYFRATGAEHDDHTAEARETGLSLVAGRTVAEFTEICAEIFTTSIAPRFCSSVSAVAAEHLAGGQDVWLVTASPVEVAELCAGHLGLTGGLGTVAERVDGKYTGRLVNGLLHGPAKAVAIQNLAATHGYRLDESYAYSDSVNDLPMLELVGHPYAVNPDGRLRRHADRMGWPVLDFLDGRRRRTVSRGLAAGVGLGLAARALVRRG
jgi:HAD superfamily hydrolase (TIGR01490 family)